ncbi:MAG: UDP-N-acetylmuramoyl-L-alanine--D-glutamate ligase [Clostridia bacterium]|nr:UDP-N-acetylmuramoyl-L-alanine--D-glutamate ligase [Clostridia bacterium]
MKKINNIEELCGKRCDILGLGISNLPLMDILMNSGATVTVRDKKSRAELGDVCERAEATGVRFILGESYLDGIDADVIFRSPGIRPDAGSIPHALKNGAILTSEMELFLSLTKAKILAITGSDGKTTTTTLTHLFLKKQAERYRSSRAYVGGNIGTPLLSEYSNMSESDFSVLELSSFQLMTASFSPARAAITNITPNHLNWHTDMSEYIRAKKNVYGESTLLVLNAENGITEQIARERRDNIVLFSSSKKSFEEFSLSGINVGAIFLRDDEIVYSDGRNEETLLYASDIILPGKHNIENYMTAIALTYGLVDKDIYTEVAKTFGGVEHRLEFVRELDGVRYYNSSIDSSPTRTAAALSALAGPKVVICGGYDKNIPFDTLADALCGSVRCVILTGATAAKIKKALLECEKYSPDVITVIEKPEFADAVAEARAVAVSGDSVLLSPACASFDAFKNFEERGNRFKALVNNFSSDKN